MLTLLGKDVAKVAPLEDVDSVKQLFEDFLIPVNQNNES